MSYEDDLISIIRDSEKWPSFERPLFLDELDDVADDAFARNSIEGYLAALLIYHQLCEEMVRLLLKDAQFLIQLSVFPTELHFAEKKRLMFGQLIDELRATIVFEDKDEFISKCLDINSHRIDIVHRLTKRSSLSDVGSQIAQVKTLYSEIYALFDGIHDWFRVSFKDFKKDVFIDY